MVTSNQDKGSKPGGVIYYTFRSNRNIDQFIDLAGLPKDTFIFVFDKPKESIKELLSLITKLEPKWVIGFASVRRRTSRWEEICQNKFSRGKVSANSPFEVLSLERPDFLENLNDIKTERRIGDTFCNQAAFKVAEHIELEGLRTKSGFLHLRA